LIRCGNKWKNKDNMSKFFFSGSAQTKLDEKNRFVLPQSMRYGLVENGALEFTIALGLGGCLAIYRKSDIEKIAEKFRSKQHTQKYQKFFTLFFSTLHHTTCDKLGRIVLPASLKKAVGIESELIIAGVLNKIEIWSKEKYEENLQNYLLGAEDQSLTAMAEEAFALLDGQVEEEKHNEKGTQVESYFCDVK